MIHETSEGRLAFTKHPVQTSRTTAYLTQLVLVLVAYFVVGVVGLAVPFTSGNVSPVWPASGIALGAILLVGYRIWPAIARLVANVTVLGLFEEWECVVAETTLASGDILALYTDGVVEATNATQQEFGEAGLAQTLRKNQHSDALSIVESVVARVQEFSAGEQKDDLTLLVARVR